VLSLALALLLAAAAADFDQYLDQIRDRVQSTWKYPAKSDSLQTTVKFNIDRAGRITDLEITRPSARKDFDASVLEAVRSATPFPPLLSILKKSEVREVGMTFKGKSVVIDAPKPAALKKSDGK
jgi:TonB family protein